MFPIGTRDRALRSLISEDLPVLLLEDDKVIQDLVLRALYVRDSHASRNALANAASTHESEEVKYMASFALRCSMEVAEWRRPKVRYSPFLPLEILNIAVHSMEYWNQARKTPALREKLTLLAQAYREERRERASDRELAFVEWIADLEKHGVPQGLMRFIASAVATFLGGMATLYLSQWLGVVSPSPALLFLALVIGLVLAAVVLAPVQYWSSDARFIDALVTALHRTRGVTLKRLAQGVRSANEMVRLNAVKTAEHLRSPADIQMMRVLLRQQRRKESIFDLDQEMACVLEVLEERLQSMKP